MNLTVRPVFHRACAVAATLLAAAATLGVFGAHAHAATTAPSSSRGATQTVTVSAPVSPTDSADDPAVSAFGGCLKAGGAGDLLLLVDSSGSLAQTDGTNGRVTAANYLVDELANYAQVANVKLDAAVATFDTQYRPVLGWTPLGANGAGALHGSINQLASANTGFETDYVSALEGARVTLSQQVRTAGGKRCQAIVWLTDGKYEIDPRVDDAQRQSFGTTKTFAPGVQITDQAAADKAQTLGLSTLCRRGGTADQLRADGVTIFAVGLAAENAPDEFDLMRKVAIGGTGCGALGGHSSGDFRRATDINGLIFAFDRIGAPGTGLDLPLRKVCASTSGCQQVHTFVLDSSIRQVQLLGSAAADGIDVYVQAPGQMAPVKLTPSSTARKVSLGGTPASYTWPTPQTISLTLRRPTKTASWIGSWKVEFVDPSGTKLNTTSQTQLHILSDLIPIWQNRQIQPRAGDATARFTFGLSRSTSAARIPLDPSALASTVSLQAELRLADGTRLRFPALSKADITKPQTLDLSKAAPGTATLHMQLAITTADAPGTPVVRGTRLADSVVDQPLNIAAPANFPAVPDTLDWGAHDTGASFTVTVPVRGAGCVFLGKVGVDTEPAEAHASIASGARAAQTCTDTGRQLRLRVATDRSQAGSLNGKLEIHLLSSDQPRREIIKPVAFTADLQQPANAAVRWAVFAFTLAVGLLVPLLLLYLFNWLTSKIPGTRQIIYGLVAAHVVDGDVRRDGAGLRLALADVSHQLAVPLNGTRQLQVGTLSLRTRVGLNPFQPGIVRVTSADGSPVVTSAERPGMALKGQLPLAVQQSWVAMPGSGAGAVSIVVILGSDATDEVAEHIADSIRELLPALAERAFPADTAQPGAPTDHWGPPSSAASHGSDWTFD